MKRSPAVAGQFYPGRKDKLLEMIEKQCFMSKFGPQKLPGEMKKTDEQPPFVVVPHAGYIYSGPIAAWSYLELSKYQDPEIIVVIGPNHYGIGPAIAVPSEVDTWETPLGEVSIGHEFIAKMLSLTNKIGKDDFAHRNEHSIEVQLPFLQYIYKEKFELVPIALRDQSYEVSTFLGEIIAEVAKNKNVVVVASSDFTHYEPHDWAKNKDQKALDTIEKMDTTGLYKIKRELNISMCGYGPIATTIEAAKRLERTKAKILKYATSGDVSGMKSQVVGYGAVAFYKK